MEVQGANDRRQLAELERHYQLRAARRLMTQGVTLRDPARFDVRGEVSVGRDVVIDINVILEGKVIIEDDVVIGPNCVIKDSRSEEHTSELQSLIRISYAVFCLKKKKNIKRLKDIHDCNYNITEL